MPSNKEYHKRWYQDNRDRRLADMKARRDDHRARVAALKESSPCTDCGVFYPWYVMHYDHIGSDKEWNVGNRMSMKWEKILTEIAKCELVCANCHAVRTYVRNHSGVAELVDAVDC